MAKNSAVAKGLDQPDGNATLVDSSVKVHSAVVFSVKPEPKMPLHEPYPPPPAEYTAGA